jgi:hypothetical protein
MAEERKELERRAQSNCKQCLASAVDNDESRKHITMCSRAQITRDVARCTAQYTLIPHETENSEPKSVKLEHRHAVFDATAYRLRAARRNSPIKRLHGARSEVDSWLQMIDLDHRVLNETTK